MSRDFPAQTERALLCDLLEERGPDAPTLCAGWRTGDLAAHLVVRENSVLASAGIYVSALAPLTARAMARAQRKPFPWIVDRVRRGGLLPQEGRWGDAVNLLEFVVHRQDILRASAEPEPSAEGDGRLRDAAVFEQLRRRAALLGRGIPAGVGLLVRSPEHGAIDIRRGPTVMIVEGGPVEVALWLFGRTAARVAVQLHGGPDDLRERVEAALRRSLRHNGEISAQRSGSSKAASMPGADGYGDRP